MTGNIYELDLNFEEISNEFITYDWITFGVIHKVLNQLSNNEVLNKCKYRGKKAAFK